MATQTSKVNAANIAFVPPPKSGGAKAIFERATEYGKHEGEGTLALPNTMSLIAYAAAEGHLKSVEDVAPVYDAYQGGKKDALKTTYVAPSKDSYDSQVSKLARPFKMMEFFASNGGLAEGLRVWQKYYTYCVGKPGTKDTGAGGRVLRNLQDMASKTVANKGELNQREMAEIVRTNSGRTVDRTYREHLAGIAKGLEKLAKADQTDKTAKALQGYAIKAEHRKVFSTMALDINELIKLLPPDPAKK